MRALRGTRCGSRIQTAKLIDSNCLPISAREADILSLVYEINNFLRKNDSSFYLHFYIAVNVEQYYKNGNRDATWKGYYRDGNIGFVCDFKDDKLSNGIFYMWDGSIRYKFLFSETISAGIMLSKSIG